MRKTLLALAAVAALAVLLAAGAAWEAHRRFTSPGPLAAPTAVVIPKGAGLDAISRRLVEAGVVADRWVFVLGAKWKKATLKAGEYEFPAGVTPEQAVALLVEGRTLVRKLTIAEGLTVRQVLAEVKEAEWLAGDITARPAEGSLLPETYHSSRDDARDEIVARMEKSMRAALDQLWATRAADLPIKTKQEALVLASIVERETGVSSERARVAAVFHNRLRLGMKLQSDPTVIYGISDGMGVIERPLTRADLDNAHPWNTYAIPALPPTPIANPGRAALEAVLNPARTDELYFVADGSGGHVFARTLEEHNRNVANWRRIERERKGR